MLMFALVVCTLLTRSCWFAEPQRCRGPVISTSTTNVARCTSKRKTIARSAPTAVAHASVATWLLFSLLPQALEDYSKLTRLNPSDAVRSTIARRTLFHACSPHVHRPCACAPLRRPQSAFCRLGQCYGQLGLVPDALEAYASAVRVSPNVRCPHRPYQRCLALC